MARHVIDTEAVYDIVQEALIVAWNRLAEIDPERGLGPWLRRTAYNLTLAHLRRSRRRRDHPNEDLVEEALARRAERLSENGDNGGFKDLLAALATCVDQLKPDHRNLWTSGMEKT